MAKIKAFPAKDIISGFKGKLDYYVHDGVACVRRWPRSPGHRRSPAVEAQWSAFAYAAAEWGRLGPEVKESYIHMAQGTGLTGRDYFTRAYLTGLYPYPKEVVDEMKLILLDEEIALVSHQNIDTPVPWTTIDITPHVGVAATIAYLRCMLGCDDKDVAGLLSLFIRKLGSSIGIPTLQQYPVLTVGHNYFGDTMCGLDADKKFEYKVLIPAPLDLVWAEIWLIGYME